MTGKRPGRKIWGTLNYGLLWRLDGLPITKPNFLLTFPFSSSLAPSTRSALLRHGVHGAWQPTGPQTRVIYFFFSPQALPLFIHRRSVIRCLLIAAAWFIQDNSNNSMFPVPHGTNSRSYYLQFDPPISKIQHRSFSIWWVHWFFFF